MMKNKFAKKLLAFVLTGAMLLALAACTKTPQEPETPAVQPSEPETPVTPEEPSPAETPAEPEEPVPAQPEQPSDPEPEAPKLATDEELDLAHRQRQLRGIPCGVPLRFRLAALRRKGI